MTIIAALTMSACGTDTYDADYLASLQGGSSSMDGYLPIKTCPSSCETITLQSMKLRTGLAPSKSILGVNDNGGVCVCPTGSGGATSTGGASNNWPSSGCVEGVTCNMAGGSSQDVATGGTSSLGVGGGSTQDSPSTGGMVSTGGTSSVGGGSTQDPPATGGGSSQDVGTGGKASTGGQSSIAGSSAVGGGSTQDPPSIGGGSSQDVGTGGKASTGGSSATGGGSSQDFATGGKASATGGTSSLGVGGGSTQDLPSTGGKASTGGQPSTGGSLATGGRSSTGGSVGTGGTCSQDCTQEQYKFWITDAKQDLGEGTVFITNERTGEVIQSSCGDNSSCCYYEIPNSCDAWLVYETTGASKMPRVPSLNTTTNSCEFIWGTMPRITTGDHIDLVEGVDYSFVIGNDGKCSMRLVPFAGTWYYN